MLQQIALLQQETEYYSMTGEYYVSGDTCSADSASSTAVETNLFDGSEVIDSEADFNFCVYGSTTKVFYCKG